MTPFADSRYRQRAIFVYKQSQKDEAQMPCLHGQMRIRTYDSAYTKFLKQKGDKHEQRIGKNLRPQGARGQIV